MDREVRAGGIPPAPALSTHMPVQKMGPQDDPEAFLDLFEKTAGECGWPQMNWPVRLIPLLTGEVQLAVQQLPVLNLLVYDDHEASHPPAGRPEPRTTSPALQIARAWGKRPALRDGSPAPGRVPQMAVGPGKAASTRSSTVWCWNNSLRGYPRRPRSGSSATARRRWTWPSNSRRTRWRRATGLAKPCLPSLSLSLLLLLFLPLHFFLGPMPVLYPGPSPDGGEDRHRSRRP